MAVSNLATIHSHYATGDVNLARFTRSGTTRDSKRAFYGADLPVQSSHVLTMHHTPAQSEALAAIVAGPAYYQPQADAN